MTTPNILPTCADLLAAVQGKQIHGYAIRIGFKCNDIVDIDLVKMECNHCWLGRSNHWDLVRLSTCQ
jgi:hypothetical protein